LRARLHHQLERLKLNERFQRELNNYMSAHTAAMHIVYGAALASGLSQFLATQAQVEHERLHRNDWRAVLLRALSEHHTFCDGGFREVYPLPANGGDPCYPRQRHCELWSSACSGAENAAGTSSPFFVARHQSFRLLSASCTPQS
jgi:hypothetical protein